MESLIIIVDVTSVHRFLYQRINVIKQPKKRLNGNRVLRNCLACKIHYSKKHKILSTYQMSSR